MALLGSNMPTEVGLRLLLSPLGSNVVVRTACCSVGIVIPVYSTFKAIETENQNEQKKVAFVLGRCPLYYHMKFAFLVWLQLPTTNGAKQLYMNHLRPFMLRHQARLDQIVGFLYSETGKFISAHQAEFQFARALVRKVSVSVKEMVKDSSKPVQSQERRVIRGPRRLVETSVETSDSGEGSGDDE